MLLLLPALRGGARVVRGGKGGGGGGGRRYERTPKGGPKPKKNAEEMAQSAESGAPGTYDSYKQWMDDGWDTLSKAQKRKLYQAGVIGFIGQRVVLGEDKIL